LLSEHPGWEVVAEAAGSREAVECCRRFTPDLVVMDLRMPEVDGLDATRAIKRDSPSTVVLVLNGYGDPDLLAEALEAGAAGYVRKSATPKQITNAVREALEGASPVDQGIATQSLLRLLKGPRKASSSRLTPKRLLGGGRAGNRRPAGLRYNRGCKGWDLLPLSPPEPAPARRGGREGDKVLQQQPFRRGR
jgi:DNA-binding NarL/FixJ family response regulator